MLAIESYLHISYIVPSSSSVTFWALGSLVRAGAMTPVHRHAKLRVGIGTSELQGVVTFGNELTNRDVPLAGVLDRPSKANAKPMIHAGVTARRNRRATIHFKVSNSSEGILTLCFYQIIRVDLLPEIHLKWTAQSIGLWVSCLMSHQTRIKQGLAWSTEGGGCG